MTKESKSTTAEPRAGPHVVERRPLVTLVSGQRGRVRHDLQTEVIPPIRCARKSGSS